MVIFDANRFGLSQLHQLRGRVGRGDKQSYCILIADPKNEIAIERMRIMTESNDGFKLAQKDLELRGQGDLLGSQQSGLPNFKVGNPVTDFNVLSSVSSKMHSRLRARQLSQGGIPEHFFKQPQSAFFPRGGSWRHKTCLTFRLFTCQTRR